MSTKPPTYTTAGVASFWRTYSITIDRGDGTGIRFGNTEAGASNLRVAFSIERNFAGPGPRQLTLTNLAEASRAKIRKGTRITIKGGYGAGLGTLCIGSVLKVKTERSGSEIVTSMDLIDSESFSTMCVVRKTYAAVAAKGQAQNPYDLSGGVYLTQVLKDIADAMQLTYDPTAPLRIVGGVAVGIKNVQYPAGLTLNGTCGDMLSMILPPQGLTWVIVNGTLSIIPRDSYNGAPVRVLNAATGLINVPSVNEKEHVLFQALLDPLLVPNSVVQLEVPGRRQLYNTVSSNPEGYYKIIKAVHRGDTHGQAWDTSCEAEVYEGDFGVLPVAVGTNYQKAVVRT